MTMLRLASTTLAVAALLSGAPTGSLSAQQPAPGGGAARGKPLPLAVGRTADFTTSAGTWISLDVSPDGRTIAFDLLGDLYTMPITGGRATRLTSGPAFDMQPRWSPDGTRLVFVSDRSGGDNVWLLTVASGDTTQLTTGNTSLYLSPEWLPEGNYILASRSTGLGGPAKLWMYHADGGSGVQLIREPATLKTVGASPTPDGRYIWYAQRTGDWSYNAVFPQYQLAVYDRETGRSTTMSSRYGSAFRPAVSPDGRWLVYGTREGTETALRIRNLDSGDERWLVRGVQRDDQESRAPMDVLPGYSWLPDSRGIVASWGGEIWRVPLEGAPVRIPFTADVNLQVGPEVKFAWRVDTAATLTARQIRNLAPSPDGRMVAFTSLDRLYVAELPAGTPRRVDNTEVGQFHPTWSPDGRSLAWVTWTDGQGGHIMRGAPDGQARPQQLTRVAALYYNLAWSPDGARIVATRGAARDLLEAVGFFGGPQGASFVWVPAAGGEVTQIAPTAGRDVAHFTDDPTRIYAYSFAEGLVSFRWDGTDQKQHLRVTGPPPPGGTNPHDDHGAPAPRRLGPMPVLPSSVDELEAGPPPSAGLVLMAPRGDQALAYVGNQIYSVTVPRVGGPVPTVSVAAPANAAVPVRQLTEVGLGGEFPAWSADGRRVYWSLGNALVSYDLDRAKAVSDSLRAVERQRADSVRQAAADTTRRAPADSAARPAAGADSARRTPPGYKPEEVRITITAPRDTPRGTVVLRGGRALTMRGQEIIENADVVVRDNRIVSVGPRGSANVPANARIIDVTGKTLMPGLVDVHYHPQWLIPEIHPGQAWHYLTNLAYGVTTTRDPQTATTDVLSYGDMVESGQMLGPRIYSTGPGLFLGENVRDLEHARNVLKRYAQYWDTKTLKMYMSGNRQQRQWIIMAAKELGIMPTTEGGLDFKLNLTHALDGYPGIEHALPITPIQRDVVELFKLSQTTNAPTLLVSYGGPFGENWFYNTENVVGDQKLRRWTPQTEFDGKVRRRGTGTGGSPGPAGWFLEEEHVFPKHAAFARDLIQNGARAAIGSHGQLQGLGYHWELWAMQSGGMSTHDALRVATIYGAEAIGLSEDLGTLEAGKLADILVLDANPLENIRNSNTIRYVMKNGRIYEGDTLNEIWPRQRALPAQWWQGGGR